MLQINSSYDGEHKSIYLLPIGDIHFGNKYFQEKYLQDALDFASRHRKRTRIILMGDMMEVATKTSVGRSVYDENYPTQKQFEVLVETFKPYADMIDLVIEGNHEERIIRDTSFEIVQEFCHRIGRIDAYGKFEGMVNYRLASGLTYSVYAWHGATGGVKESSAINGLLSMRERAVAHIYLMGHTHKLLKFDRELEVPNPGHDRTHTIRQMFVNTGTAVGDGGYATQKGLARQRIGYGVIQLFANERKQVFHHVEDLL